MSTPGAGSPPGIGPGETRELREALPEIIQSLPHRRRLMARAFVGHFEQPGRRDTHEVLARAVAEATGRAENAEAVKSAWRAARTRFRAEWSRRGYSPG